MQNMGAELMRMKNTTWGININCKMNQTASKNIGGEQTLENIPVWSSVK